MPFGVTNIEPLSKPQLVAVGVAVAVMPLEEVTVVVTILVQPVELVTVTLYAPAESPVGLKLVNAAFDHK